MKPKIAFAMIAKNNEDTIERVLESTKGVFDFYALQDTGSKDKTIEVWEAWCKKNNKDFKTCAKSGDIDYPYVDVDGRKFLANFAMARNDSFRLIPEGYDFAFWADDDDVIVNAEQIPALVEFCVKNDIGQALLEYVYAQSDDGLKPVTQVRERLISLKLKGEWVNWVHENYRVAESVKAIMPEQLRQLGFNIYLQHLRSVNEALATNRRNNQIMMKQLEEEGMDKFSDEMLNHLAFDHWEHREWDKCIEYYELLLKRFEGKQVHPEQIFQIAIKLGKAYSANNQIENAVKCAFRAIALVPNIADGYLLLAELYAGQQNWEEASHYADKVLKLGKPNTTAPINEYEYAVIPLRMKIQAALGMGRLEEAIALTQELLKILPNNPMVKQELYGLKKEHKRIMAAKAVGELSNYMRETNQADMLEKLREAIPFDMLDNEKLRPLIKEIKGDYKRKTLHVEFKGPKNIVLFAGGHYETWDGESDITKGIGGSEGMCIQLMRELAALGNKVYIYNECGESDGKMFDGVTYLHHSKWSPDLKCDVFISLRHPDIFSQVIKAKKQYLWLHDTEYGEIPLMNFYLPNKVIVLTDSHKDIIKLNHGIDRDDIFYISRNALNPIATQYALKNAGKRKPYQCIYASSYDRGLDNALKMWPKIKEAVPEATLKIFYGWNGFDKMMNYRMQANPQAGQWMKNYKSGIIEMISKCDGVQELGRITQNQLYQEFAESGVWFYPTQFQEISCITAMQAHAMGAIPVCTPIAALNETVNSKFGVKVNLDQIQSALIDILKASGEGKLEEKRTEMAKWALDVFDMKKLAIEWDKFFNED